MASWKDSEVVTNYFQVVSQNFRGGREENHEGRGSLSDGYDSNQGLSKYETRILPIIQCSVVNTMFHREYKWLHTTLFKTSFTLLALKIHSIHTTFCTWLFDMKASKFQTHLDNPGTANNRFIVSCSRTDKSEVKVSHASYLLSTTGLLP
jgi:hypothetical protein